MLFINRKPGRLPHEPWLVSCSMLLKFHQIISISKMSTLLLLSLTVFFTLLLRKYVASWKKHQLYWPGPKPKPFIGNILDLPTEDVPDVYIEWGKKYNSGSNQIFSPDLSIRRAKGSILHTMALGSHIVVLNQLEDAIELFKKCVRIYSNHQNILS